MVAAVGGAGVVRFEELADRRRSEEAVACQPCRLVLDMAEQRDPARFYGALARDTTAMVTDLWRGANST